jgi:hypothetical protein
MRNHQVAPSVRGFQRRKIFCVLTIHTP